VQQGLVDYLFTRALPYPYTLVERFKERVWFIERTGLWPPERALQTLGMPARDLHWLFSCGPLVKCLWPRSRRNTPLFERDKVLAVKQQWEVEWPMRYACSWLGLEKTDVAMLVWLGILTVERDRKEHDDVDWMLNRQSIEMFFESVAGQLELYQGDPRDLRSLYSVEHATSSFGIDRVALLQGVADGLLPGYKREPELQTLGDVCFLDSMIPSLPDRLSAEREWSAGRKFTPGKFASKLIFELTATGHMKPGVVFERYRNFERRSLE
jgi:hypothetical protein